MGEVRAQVKLSNAMDVGMVRRGLLNENQVRSIEVEALVDPAAVHSCIPLNLQHRLGLKTARQINAQMANGEIETANVTEAVYIDIMDRLATQSFLVLGAEVLLGQTVLRSTDLLVDCGRGRVIANPAHPDSAVILIR